MRKGMETNPLECLFCHADLPKVQDEPVNLAFLSHIEASDPCRDAFAAWTDNMQDDFKGD
jgi:hypothetical protein